MCPPPNDYLRSNFTKFQEYKRRISENMDKLPIEIITFEIFSYFEFLDLIKLERTNKLFQQAVFRIPNKEIILRGKFIRKNFYIGDSWDHKDDKDVTNLLENSLSKYSPSSVLIKRSCRWYLDHRWKDFVASLKAGLFQSCNTITRLDVSGIPLKNEEFLELGKLLGKNLVFADFRNHKYLKVSVFNEFLSLCRNLTELNLGVQYEKHAIVLNCPLMSFTNECIVETVTNLYWRKMKCFQMYRIDTPYGKPFFGYHNYMMSTLHCSHDSLEKIAICDFYRPSDKFLPSKPEEFLQSYPNLKVVRLQHSKISLLFRSHSKIEVYEGKISDREISDLVTFNKNLRKLILYEEPEQFTELHECESIKTYDELKELIDASNKENSESEEDPKRRGVKEHISKISSKEYEEKLKSGREWISSTGIRYLYRCKNLKKVLILFHRLRDGSFHSRIDEEAVKKLVQVSMWGEEEYNFEWEGPKKSYIEHVVFKHRKFHLRWDKFSNCTDYDLYA